MLSPSRLPTILKLTSENSAAWFDRVFANGDFGVWWGNLGRDEVILAEVSQQETADLNCGLLSVFLYGPVDQEVPAKYRQRWVKGDGSVTHTLDRPASNCKPAICQLEVQDLLCHGFTLGPDGAIPKSLWAALSVDRCRVAST
jgi:hypothetical protein